MKKTSFLLAFMALSVGSIIAQSCSKTAAQKAKNTTVAAVKSVENTPKNVDKNVDKSAEIKTVEKADVAVVDKPIEMEKPVEKSVEMMGTTPQKTAETTVEMAEVTPVVAPKSMKTSVQNTPQVIDNKPVATSKPSKMVAFDHSAWNDLLKKNVSATGKVNYKGFKADLELLDAYMRSLNEGAPTENASKEERFAYWINAYNAVTVRLIVANYPLASITKLDGGKPWDVKRYANGGKKLSLNDIENNILRPMGDARIHFALNCAAKSCPPLLNEAFTADNVNKLLEQRTRQFINSATRTVIEKDEIKVSKVFDWYGKDFGNVVDFVNKYAKTKAAKTAKVTFLDYDWNLND